MTVAQFFRVNGGTTQLRGVTPDIAYPTFIDADSYGESSYDNALPWVQIKPADYQPVGNLKDFKGCCKFVMNCGLLKIRNSNSLRKISLNTSSKKKKEISLNEAERRAERDAREKKENQRA